MVLQRIKHRGIVLAHDGRAMEPNQLVPPLDSAALCAFALSALKKRNAENTKTLRATESVMVQE